MLKLVQIPAIIQRFFPSIIWNKEKVNKTIYLTFDDGPHESLTPFILDELKKYKAKATFFYQGSQAEKHPLLLKRCVEEKHQIGNHTYSHLNGWATKNEDYFKDIEKANEFLHSKLFRPPYGRIKPSQIRHISQYYDIIMWDILSWDFDKNTSTEECYNNIISNAMSGSIIVLHENEKSIENVKQVLPRVLSYFNSHGFKFETL